MTSTSTAPLLLTSSLLLLFGTAAEAQVTFSAGPRVGGQLSTVHYNTKFDFSPIQSRTGFELGAMGSFTRGHFALQPALLYSQKGYERHETYTVTVNGYPSPSTEHIGRCHLNYITLPVSLAFCQHANGQGAQVFAGPYLSLLLGGRYEGTNTQAGVTTSFDSKITPVNNDYSVPGSLAQRFDAGLQAGLGYRYQSILFQANYSLGLRNVGVEYPNALFTNAYYNRAVQVSLSYLFELK